MKWDGPAAGRILVAFEKLFGGGRGVRRHPRTNLRHVELEDGALLVEQSPRGAGEWAERARAGRRVAWVVARDGTPLARVNDGEITMLEPNDEG